MSSYYRIGENFDPVPSLPIFLYGKKKGLCFGELGRDGFIFRITKAEHQA